MNIGIIGAGHIAEKMARTLSGMPQHRSLAVGSRSLEKALSFARDWGFERAYGSYEELVRDPDVDLVYVATPNSHHFAHVMLCLQAGKPVLCEKTFMMNAAQAREVFRVAGEKGLFVTEAIWTRYMPFSAKIRELAYSGIIGRPLLIHSSLSYPVTHKERVMRPELGGGAMLDVGVYVLNFARMVFADEPVEIRSSAVMGETGVDLQNEVSMVWADGRMANLQTSVLVANDRQGIISGESGYIVVDNVNNPLEARVFNKAHELVEVFHAPEQITGFEYQVEACAEALSHGWLESPFMPHAETVRIMEIIDDLLAEWGVPISF